MNRSALRLVVLALGTCALLPTPAGGSSAQGPEDPVVVVETSKGTFAFEAFAADAPASVAHVVSLVRSGFYDGQRVHRAQADFVVQFGDPQSRDLSKRAVWGRGAAASSGHPIGVAEMSSKHKNLKGAVGLAHMGDPKKADSQLYVALADLPDLDNRYVVIGRLVSGASVPEDLQVGDLISRMYVKD